MFNDPGFNPLDPASKLSGTPEYKYNDPLWAGDFPREGTSKVNEWFSGRTFSIGAKKYKVRTVFMFCAALVLLILMFAAAPSNDEVTHLDGNGGSKSLFQVCRPLIALLLFVLAYICLSKASVFVRTYAWWSLVTYLGAGIVTGLLLFIGAWALALVLILLGILALAYVIFVLSGKP